MPALSYFEGCSIGSNDMTQLTLGLDPRFRLRRLRLRRTDPAVKHKRFSRAPGQEWPQDPRATPSKLCGKSRSWVAPPRLARLDSLCRGLLSTVRHTPRSAPMQPRAADSSAEAQPQDGEDPPEHAHPNPSRCGRSLPADQLDSAGSASS